MATAKRSRAASKKKMVKAVKKKAATKKVVRKKSVVKKAVKKSTPKKTVAPQVPVYDFSEANELYAVLNQVIDPEVGIGIADMGLIYDAKLENGVAMVTMTLTSMGCPMGPSIAGDIEAILRLEDGIKEVELEVVWEPAWTPDLIKPELKEMLFGGYG